MRVVFDTNVFGSQPFSSPVGQAERAFLMGRRRYTLFTSVPLLTETAETLRAKFDQSEDDISTALRLISRAAQVVTLYRQREALHKAAGRDAPGRRSRADSRFERIRTAYSAKADRTRRSRTFTHRSPSGRRRRARAAGSACGSACAASPC
jgi:hypothetical protein